MSTHKRCDRCGQESASARHQHDLNGEKGFLLWVFVHAKKPGDPVWASHDADMCFPCLLAELKAHCAAAAGEATLVPPAPEVGPNRPPIVCLCGSTRFWREFQAASLRETLAGKIVLSIGAASGTDDEHFGNLPKTEYDAVKAQVDELHLRKIDLADEALILNVGGYIDESTARELAHARDIGKAVRFLEHDLAAGEECLMGHVKPDGTPAPACRRCIRCHAWVDWEGHAEGNPVGDTSCHELPRKKKP